MMLPLAKGIVAGLVAGGCLRWLLRQPRYTPAGFVHDSALRSVGSAVLHQHRKHPGGEHVALYRLEVS